MARPKNPSKHLQMRLLKREIETLRKYAGAVGDVDGAIDQEIAARERRVKEIRVECVRDALDGMQVDLSGYTASLWL